uniref:Integrase catalytic domain-containing protein n=1 Tax=Panagrellus redivivus TaxID=6233 RepID=A0A7E4W3U4_PANRE
MRRFVARRGRPSTILSDNGTNLKAAAQPVSQHWRSFDTTVINDYLGDNRIEWNFITERAPWKGGVYERMIGVMKKALRAMIGRRIMYNALLNTLLTEVENIVNYRPLTYLENDFDVSDGFRALRPIDFILPWCDNGAPFFDGDDDASNDPDYKVRDSTRDKLIDTWKSSTAHIDRFNKRWLAEYLPMLREVSATAHRQQGTPRSPIVNEVVHIYEEDAPRALWRLGIVTETHVSPDGHVRSASVRTPNGRILQRSIAHLYPLEVHAVEDYQPKVPEPTAEPPTRTLRPRKLAYFIMTLLLMITTSAANPCPANTSDLIPVHVQECLPHGMVIFKDYNDALCWQNVYCGEQHLRQPIDNERHSLCGSPCRCEKWADGCSYYTGPATELSTIGNALTQQLMEDAAPDSGMRMASELQLFDGHRFFVKELKLIHQQVDPKHIDCIGHGDITGSPAYCSQHRCVAHATRFCFYQTHELVLWLHEARTVPIKAWSFVRPYQPHGVSLWSSETDHTVTLSCDHSGIHLKTDADMNMMEIEATGIFFAVSINNKSTIVPLPTQLLVSNIDLKLTMQFNDGL